MNGWCPENDGAYRDELAYIAQGKENNKILRLKAENARMRSALYECLDEAMREELELKTFCSFIRGATKAALEGEES